MEKLWEACKVNGRIFRWSTSHHVARGKKALSSCDCRSCCTHPQTSEMHSSPINNAVDARSNQSSERLQRNLSSPDFILVAIHSIMSRAGIRMCRVFDGESMVTLTVAVSRSSACGIEQTCMEKPTLVQTSEHMPPLCLTRVLLSYYQRAESRAHCAISYHVLSPRDANTRCGVLRGVAPEPNLEERGALFAEDDHDTIVRLTPTGQSAMCILCDQDSQKRPHTALCSSVPVNYA